LLQSHLLAVVLVDMQLQVVLEVQVVGQEITDQTKTLFLVLQAIKVVILRLKETMAVLTLHHWVGGKVAAAVVRVELVKHHQAEAEEMEEVEPLLQFQALLLQEPEEEAVVLGQRLEVQHLPEVAPVQAAQDQVVLQTPEVVAVVAAKMRRAATEVLVLLFFVTQMVEQFQTLAEG
jgi:hypothetical protein